MDCLCWIDKDIQMDFIKTGQRNDKVFKLDLVKIFFSEIVWLNSPYDMLSILLKVSNNL